VFRYKRSIKLSYERQGYIYFLSRSYSRLPTRKQEKIRQLCDSCGGEYSGALFDFVTTDDGAAAAWPSLHLSQPTLERVVKKYYEAFPMKL